MEAVRTDDDLTGLRSAPELSPLADKWRVLQAARNAADAIGSGLARAEPGANGVGADALARLQLRAETSGTSSLVVLHRGRIVEEWYRDGASELIELMSATKSVVALLLASLADEHKLSFDDPVWKFYPEWKQGRKALITVRHLLDHTSGLQAQAVTREIYASPDFVQLALAAELTTDPGVEFFYNNKAVNLLAGIAERASGKKLDAYAEERLFRPLGIRRFVWTKDKAGNPHAMAGLQLHALDAAKLGELVLERGLWQGRQVISSERVDELMRPGLSPTHGLLFWILYERSELDFPVGAFEAAEKAGLSKATAAKIAGLDGQVWLASHYWREQSKRLLPQERGELWRALHKAGIAPQEKFIGAPAAYAARGYLGQYILVVPGAQLVAVRQAQGGTYASEDVELFDFDDLVRSLVAKPSSP